MKFLKLLIVLFLCLNFSCNSEDIDDQLGSQFNTAGLEKITQDEELFEIISRIATDEEEDHLNITCINFRYPLAIFTLDENDEFVALDSVLDDNDFSLLLESIDPEYSISVSFPIETTLETGEEFIIESKEDLKTAIDQCLDEEIVNDCNGFLGNNEFAGDCFFRVGYSFNSENPYLGAYFEESDGFTTFNFQEESYVGSWTALIIEDELHINISLIEASEDIEEQFNHDWVAEFIDSNTLKLTFEDQELIINKKCSQDFGVCASFNFEECENDLGSEISDFLFRDYKGCIIDVLEFEPDVLVSYHLTPEDAINNENPINGNEVFNNTENNQSIFVKLKDDDMEAYIVEIILISITCQ